MRVFCITCNTDSSQHGTGNACPRAENARFEFSVHLIWHDRSLGHQAEPSSPEAVDRVPSDSQGLGSGQPCGRPPGVRSPRVPEELGRKATNCFVGPFSARVQGRTPDRFSVDHFCAQRKRSLPAGSIDTARVWRFRRCFGHHCEMQFLWN